MQETPVNDFFHTNTPIQANGSVLLTMYLFEVKPSSKAKERWGIYDLRGTLPSPQAFPPPGRFGCPLVRS
jgi:branched-chain amino acid transport system substrate-binding protein